MKSIPVARICQPRGGRGAAPSLSFVDTLVPQAEERETHFVLAALDRAV